MSYDKIKLKLSIELPGQPPISPSIFRSLEKNRSKDGSFAKTIAEQFPFGLVAKEPPDLMRFNWGEENFQFLADMLQTDDRLHDIYKEWAQSLFLKNLLVNRDLVRTDDIERFNRRLQEISTYKQLRIVKGIFASIDAFQYRFDFYRKQVDSRLALFVRLHTEKRFSEMDLLKKETIHIRNNPNDLRLKWPSELPLIYKERMKIYEKSLVELDRIKKGFERLELNIDFHRNRLDQNYVQHQVKYSTQVPIFNARALIDDRPGKAKWGGQLELGLQLGSVEPGTKPKKRDIG